MAVVIGIVWSNFHLKTPLEVIDKAIIITAVTQTPLVASETYPPERKYHRLNIQTDNIGEIEAYISSPTEVEKPLPLLIIMGGWESGAKNFRLIPNPGNYHILFYRYSYQPDVWKEGWWLREVFAMREAILEVPTQVLALQAYLASLQSVDPSRISVMGFSLGALFVPSVYHLASHRDVGLAPGVIAFGGADLAAILSTNLKQIPSITRVPLASTAAYVLDAVEPIHHLSHMDNRFLLLHAANDEMMNVYSRGVLEDLVLEPKESVTIESGHIGTNKKELIEKVVQISTDWLEKVGVLGD